MNKFYALFENHFVKFFISIFILVFCGNKIFLLLSKKALSLQIDSFLTSTLYSAFSSKDGTLTTIAAVFIGIYFTVLSLLGSINIESTFAVITRKNFVRLLSFIKHACLSAFIFLFYSLLMPIFTTHFNWFAILFYIILLLYMLLTATKIGIVLYLIFKRDLSKLHTKLESEKQQKQKEIQLKNRMEKFLDVHEKTTQLEKNQKISEIVKSRNHE
ncbi:hypothetical protein [Bacillus cereus]|uniref:hypothetical protein n=1 Tax=Bacillus cereus TaxID=1396 RepID=UPI000BF5357D|nr:hypothetical protein [Bacillus cereus]PER23527.1 hypothetical protein CN476_17415 [Bacillus cereus]